MLWNLFSQSNKVQDDAYNYDKDYEKRVKLAKLVAVLIVIGFIVLIAYFLNNKVQHDKYTKSATAAARQQIPDAQVRQLKVADGFAIATVSSPSATSQVNAGNMTVFKLNNDDSMTQIASGSTFNPVDLSALGIPLATQAKLTGQNLTQIRKALGDTCNYKGGDTPGYSGFNSSFDPDGWQIDAGTLDNLERALSSDISHKNTTENSDKKIVCINATRKNSNAATDMKTYISTFTIELQFVAADGTISTHQFTFAIGPNYYQNYTLDGQKIASV